MPAGTTNFNKQKTMWNPGYVYYGCAVPAPGAIITVVIDANGIPTPDATENPNHIHLGYTPKGTKCLYKWTKTDATDNEHTMPHDVRLTGEEMTITGQWKQLLDADLLEKMSVGGTKSSITGGTLIDFGGQDVLTPACIAVFAPRKEDPTKIIQFVLYSAYNTEGVEFTNDKDAEADSPFTFVGLSLANRPKKKQAGYIYIPSLS
ncbi:MAG TPA: hypothetical protein VJS44_04630 [Pyrinomonadaceae bacterium]|nr:hypothetical protein [Pyrinomonadaceae bacterium]